MKTYCELLSDESIPANELIQRIAFCQEEDIPDEIVQNLGIMLMGSGGTMFEKLCVMIDTETNLLYGILFLHREATESEAKLSIGMPMIDVRLKNEIFLGKLFQSLINDFCNQHFEEEELFVEWGNNLIRQRAYQSREVTDAARRIAEDVCK